MSPAIVIAIIVVVVIFITLTAVVPCCNSGHYSKIEDDQALRETLMEQAARKGEL